MTGMQVAVWCVCGAYDASVWRPDTIKAVLRSLPSERRGCAPTVGDINSALYDEHAALTALQEALKTIAAADRRGPLVGVRAGVLRGAGVRAPLVPDANPQPEPAAPATGSPDR